MQRGITESRRVILVCAEGYVTKAEAGSGGVGYERLIVTAEIVQNIDTKKFIPVLRHNAGAHKVPSFIGPRLYIDFSVDGDYQSQLDQLVREILGVPSVAKPPLGPNPFSGSAPASTAVRATGSTGLT
ncbi:MAG: toll/interleukin-1 receptor domain-containing protein [Chloroflexi bacterium]|nr:toll/interleukin-1 receptor domain-containing protein [Chloroflexota bacterium]